MIYLYKLGDGPINYDWNHRYAWIEGSELFYSPSLDDREKKTLNISGAAVTNICKIKGKDYAFGIILNPPTNKIIYFASDDIQETENFKERVVIATLNNLYDDPNAINEFDDFHNTISFKNNNNNSNHLIVNANSNPNNLNNFNINNTNNNRYSFPEYGNKNKNNNEKLFKIGFNIKKKLNTDEFYRNLEILRKDYIIDDSKQIKRFGRGLKISVPEELEYSNFYYNCLSNRIFSIIIYL